MLNYYINGKSVFLIALFFAVLCLKNTTAQKVDISNGIKLNNKASQFRIAGKLNNKYLAERYKGNYHVLDVYNGFLKLQSSKIIPVESNETLKKLWVNPQKSWIIKLSHFKGYSTLNALQLDDKIRIAEKATIIDTLSEKSDLLNNNLRTQLSLNENLILVYAPIFENGKIKHFYTKVLNNKLEVLSSKLISHNYLINNYFVDVFLLNDGSFIFITTDNNESDNADYFITYTNKQGQVTTSIYNPIQDVFKKIKFEVDNNTNSLFASGLYREPQLNKRDNTGASKFFITKIDLHTFETAYTDIAPFTTEFYNQLTGKESETTPPQLYTFYINKIIPKNDGGCLVLAESYFRNEEESLNNYYYSINGMNTYSTSTIYNFNDILVYNIDNNGIIDKNNINIIRKKQVSSNDNGAYSSFYTANLQNQLQLIYLDDIDNDAQLLSETLNANTSKNNVVLNISSKDVVPIVKMSVQTAPNEILVPSMSKNRMKLIKIVY